MRFRFRLLAVAGALLLAAGCAAVGGIPGGSGLVHIDEGVPFDNNANARYAATIRLLPYTDARKTGNPRLLGHGGHQIYGFGAPSGDAILLDQNAADLVTAAMAHGLKDAGYRVVPAPDKAHFEMSGTVTALSYDVNARDSVNISISTQVKDLTTGHILWSGIVVEKKSQFTGVSGDSISDVAVYLKYELGIVVHKTVDAINTPLMERYPGLFNLASGSHPAAGVTVMHQAPALAPIPAPVTGVVSTTAATDNGTLKLSTRPTHAEIYIGGVYYGLSPLTLKLPPGIVEVTARKDGRKTVRQKVAIRSGKTTPLELKLRK